MKSQASPTWDLSNILSGLSDPRKDLALKQVADLTSEIKGQCEVFVKWLNGAQGPLGVPPGPLVGSILEKRDQAKTLVHDIITYCHGVLSVDGTMNQAKKILANFEALDAELNVVLKPLNLWFTLAPQSDIDSLELYSEVRSEVFNINKLRELKNQSLSLKEEAMLEQLELHAPMAFGRLYDDLVGVLKCQIAKADAPPMSLGLAEASNLLTSPDETLRKQTYLAINQTFQEHEESFSAIINNITGWRQSVLKLRSTNTAQHYLDPALHQAQIKKETLDSMLLAVQESKALCQSALKTQANLLGKSVLDPWDLMAPCPIFSHQKAEGIAFDDGINKIRKAFGSLSVEMAEFITLMAEKKWIDASIGPNKRPGAYCTQFFGPREPRVYMTYSGSLSNLSTLAHELGHAMHFWLMRDLPLAQLSYPMTLAETASIFAESLLVEHLIEELGQDKKNHHQLLALLWEISGDAAVFLLNIPARFEMECLFNDHRQNTVLTSEDLKSLTDRAWTHWYGTSLSQNNTMFWASKLHFSIGSMSFYNFPYTFGYLFSLSIFASRSSYGGDFFKMYRELLRDTGRMSAEDVAQKHLGEDISKPDFWRKALSIVRQRIGQFHELASSYF